MAIDRARQRRAERADWALTHPHTLHRQMVVRMGGYYSTGALVSSTARPRTMRRWARHQAG